MKAFKVTATSKTESVVFAETADEAISVHTEKVAQGKATVLADTAKAVRNKEAEAELFATAVADQEKALASNGK